MEKDGCSNARVCVAAADFVYKGEKNYEIESASSRMMNNLLFGMHKAPGGRVPGMPGRNGGVAEIVETQLKYRSV
jgi:hypothetical protein